MAIAFDSVGTGETSAAGGTFSWTHTVVSNTNGILLAAVGQFAGTGTITGLKFAGQNLTSILGTTNVGDAERHELWYLLTPPTGLGTFNGTWSAAGAGDPKENIS